MKHLFTLLLIIVFSSTQAQYLLILDGETPYPFSDKAGYNSISTVGTPLNTSNAVEFPTGNDYLLIDPFVSFDLNVDWMVSFDINVSNTMDSIYIIDWRSNSSTGHMNIAYNGNRGLFFSDREVNGIYGSLVANSAQLPINSWVHFDVEREGDSLFIHRDNIQVASSYFTGTLSALSTTTIGYSQDFRYAHASFMIDNLTLTGSSITGVNEVNEKGAAIYPNPATEEVNIPGNKIIDEISISDATGRLLLHVKNPGKSVDISILPSGVYIIDIVTEESVSKQRLIKK